MTLVNDTLENKLASETPKDRSGVADTIGKISASLVLGAFLDYASGLSVSEILASRGSAIFVNGATGSPYGKWRNYLFKRTQTTKESPIVKKYLVDLLAFNTFEVPLYAGIVFSSTQMGNIISGQTISFEETQTAAKNLVYISPIVGPVLGWYMNLVRHMFHSKSPAEKAQIS